MMLNITFDVFKDSNIFTDYHKIESSDDFVLKA